MLPAENFDNSIKEFWPKNGPSIQEVEKYVKKYSKEKIVIKCGGRVLLDPALLNSLIEELRLKEGISRTHTRPILKEYSKSKLKKDQ